MPIPFVQDGRLDLDRLFATYGDKTALVTDTQRLSFADIRQRLIALVQTLNQLGVGAGDQVALYQENSLLHLLMVPASWLMNFYFIPLNFKTPLAEVLTRIDIDVLISKNGEGDQGIGQVYDARFIGDLMGERISGPPPDTLDRLFRNISLDRETSVVFTSGSTGAPSGVVHTVGNFIFSALGTVEFMGLNDTDSWLVSLPLYHVGGLLIFVRTLLSGGTCILPPDLKQVEAAIGRHRPAVMSLVPTQLLRFMESPETLGHLRSSKAILIGGAPSPPWLINRALACGLPIVPTYGSTEACAQVTAVAPGSPQQAYHTSGKVLPYRGLTLDPEGRIIISGATLFKYYIRQKRKVCPLKNNAFKTSDRGEWDGDGNLKILGRSDQVFISGGENIHPHEIEQHLMAIDHITSAVVVPAPHKEFGFVPWAFVETSAPLQPDTIKAQLKKRLPAYKVPKHIHILTPEEKQGEMKFKRKDLYKWMEKCISTTAGQADGQSGDVPSLMADNNTQRPVLAAVEQGRHEDTIVLLHGFMGQAASFKTIMEALSAQARVIALDLPGHGGSRFDRRPALNRLSVFSDVARAALDTLDTMGVRSFYLYGYSMGGRIAQNMCLLAPAKIRHLILESAAFGIQDEIQRKQRYDRDRKLLSGINSPDDFRRFISAWHASPLFCTLHGDPLLEDLARQKQTNAIFDLQKALCLMSVGNQPFFAQALADLDIPVTFFYGAHDEKYGALIQAAVPIIPRMQVRCVPNASHNIHAQFPEVVIKGIKEIISRRA